MFEDGLKGGSTTTGGLHDGLRIIGPRIMGFRQIFARGQPSERYKAIGYGLRTAMSFSYGLKVSYMPPDMELRSGVGLQRLIGGIALWADATVG